MIREAELRTRLAITVYQGIIFRMRFAVLVRRNQFVKGVDEQSPIAARRKALPVGILGFASISVGSGAVLHYRNDY